MRTPDQVAQTFWEAMAKQDIQAAREQVTDASRESLDKPDAQVADAEASFGEIRIKGDDAAVDTTLAFPADEKRPPIDLKTYLKKEHGQWKIDYLATRESLSRAAPFGRLMDDLRQFTDALSENLEDAISNLQKDLPQIEEQAKSMAERLKEQLEEFSRAIEEAFKKRREDKPEPEEPPDQYTL